MHVGRNERNMCMVIEGESRGLCEVVAAAAGLV